MAGLTGSQPPFLGLEGAQGHPGGQPRSRRTHPARGEIVSYHPPSHRASAGSGTCILPATPWFSPLPTSQKMNPSLTKYGVPMALLLLALSGPLPPRALQGPWICWSSPLLQRHPLHQGIQRSGCCTYTKHIVSCLTLL